MVSLAKWICYFAGHDWVPVWETKSKTFDAMSCARCKEMGWRT